MTNLFKKAKAEGATAGKPKNDKVVVEISDSTFHYNVSRLAEVNAELKTLSAEAATIEDEIKPRAISEFKKLYEQAFRNPGSFIIRTKAPIKAKTALQPTASFMFIPNDKYLSLDEERAAELKETYGDTIVTETTTYTMDAALVEKYGEVISRLIETSKEITKDDKEKLIKAVTKYTVTKGTLENLKTPEFAKHDLAILLEDIKPVYALKNVKKDI